MNLTKHFKFAKLKHSKYKQINNTNSINFEGTFERFSYKICNFVDFELEKYFGCKGVNCTIVRKCVWTPRAHSGLRPGNSGWSWDTRFRKQKDVWQNFFDIFIAILSVTENVAIYAALSWFVFLFNILWA